MLRRIAAEATFRELCSDALLLELLFENYAQTHCCWSYFSRITLRRIAAEKFYFDENAKTTFFVN